MDYFAQLLVNGLVLGAIYALAAVAYSVVYGVIRLVNFAFGELFMLGAVLTATFMLPSGTLLGFDVTLPELPFWAAVGLALICVGAIGALLERLAFRPLRHAPRLAPLICSIAISTLLMNLAQMVWGAQQISMPETPISARMPLQFLGGVFITWSDISVGLVMIIIMLGFTFFIKYSRLGRAMRATAENRLAALIVGIPADKIITLTFAIGAVFAAIAGILYAQSYGSVYASMGFVPGLKALTAAILGGIGSLPGAAIGGLVLGVVESLGSGYIPGGTAYKDAISFALLVLLLLLRPQGLLGKAEARERISTNWVGQGGKTHQTPRLFKMATTFHTLVPYLTPSRLLVLTILTLGIMGALTPSNYVLQIMTTILVYAMLASGLNVIVGFTGLLDLGFAAFWAVGSYVSGIIFVLVLQNTYGLAFIDVWWLLYPLFFVGAAVAIMFGMMIGFPAVRLRGDYLAIVTLGFGEIIRIIATNWIELTRGPMGIRNIAPPNLFGYSLGQPRSLFFFALIMAAGLVICLYKMIGSRIGRALIAIREDEDAAAATGINTARFKLLAYGFSAAIGGMVGVFYAHMQRYIGPANFSFTENITLLLLIVIGGLGTLVGPFIGAALWVLFLQLTLNIPLVQNYPEIRYVFLGLALVCLMICRPQGIAPQMARPQLLRQNWTDKP